MVDHQSEDVSFPPWMLQFIRDHVDRGRFPTLSEVLEEGLRLQQRAEHRRLLAKWLDEELSPREAETLPREVLVRAHERWWELMIAGVLPTAENLLDGPRNTVP